MIVKIAAWLYLINAALSVASVTMGPFGLQGSASLGTLMFAGLCTAMGVGLLQQKSWARWLALGSSFLGWTLGSLLFVVSIGFLLSLGKTGEFFALMSAGGTFGFIAMLALFFLLVWLVELVISFKLFWYLCSEDGCEEFGVPYGSAQTVAASAAAWVGICIVQGMMSGGGSLAGLAAASMMADREDSHDSERRQREYERQQADRERERAERRVAQRLRDEEEVRARNDAELARAAQAEAYPASAPAYEAPVTQRYAAPEAKEEEKPATNRILKCRDASGSVTFTQGYCPSGTKQVEMPASE